MTIDDLRKCFDIIFGKGPRNIEQLNRIYTKTAVMPLDNIGESGVVGFKMRFTPPIRYPFHINRLPGWNKLSDALFRIMYQRSFKKMMFDTLRRHDVIILMAIRQDVLRLALSKYHGDGTGEPGHLQFKLARGVIARNEIEKINVDCERLEKIVSKCEALHEKNRRLMQEFKQAGNQIHPILYEEFVSDKRSYLESLFKILELDITGDEITQVLEQEEYFKKVHSDDISEFVENYEEVTHRFAGRYVSWRGL